MTSISVKWSGADGGSWSASGNWSNLDGSPANAAPGVADYAEFLSFSGTVTGAVGCNILDVGPGSSVTLDGSGFFSTINVGQDADFNLGDASLTIAASEVVSATLLWLGAPSGGSGTLTANGTFSTTGGIVMDASGLPCNITVGSGGDVEDGANLTMAAGGQIQIGSSGRMVIGSSAGGDGALTIDKNFFFYGEGTITGNVIDNGMLETFNGGNSANVLTVTGAVTGSGAVNVVQEMDLNGAVGAGVTIALFANGGSNAGLLRLGNAAADAGKLGVMSTGSIIALTGLTYDQVSQSANALTLTGASSTLTLAMTGDHSFQHFILQPDAHSGTDIVVEVGAPLTIAVTTDTGSKDNPPITKDDTISGGGTGGGIIHFKVDGVDVAGTATANLLGHWSFTPTGLADGTHTITASEQDAGGHAMTASLTFTLDTHAPATPTIAKASLVGGVWTLSGSAEAGATIAIDDGAAKLAGTATANASGAWSLKTGRKADTVHVFTAVAADSAGNVSPHSSAWVEGTTKADAIAWAHGGARFFGRGGGDKMNASGHAGPDTFVYLAAGDSLDKVGAFDTIVGFADKGNGKAFDDILDLSAIRSVSKLQGALTKASQKVAAHSVAFIDNASAKETFVFANTGATALAQTSASLMEIALSGGPFKLAAGNFHLA